MASRWFLIVRDGVCPEYGLRASSIRQSDLGDAMVEEARRWSDVLNVPSEVLSARWAPEVWSPLEYAGHVRDNLVLIAERAQLAIVVVNPHFENQDQETAVVARRDNDEDPRQVAAAIRANAEGFAQMLVTLPARTLVAWRDSIAR